jgi:hypothetical protein
LRASVELRSDPGERDANMRPNSALAGKEDFHADIGVREVTVFVTFASVAVEIHGDPVGETVAQYEPSADAIRALGIHWSNVDACSS